MRRPDSEQVARAGADPTGDLVVEVADENFAPSVRGARDNVRRETAEGNVTPIGGHAGGIGPADRAARAHVVHADQSDGSCRQITDEHIVAWPVEVICYEIPGQAFKDDSPAVGRDPRRLRMATSTDHAIGLDA